MIRLLAFAILALPASVLAQDTSRPIIRTELKETAAIPGQPLVLRVTVLVPTWMPRPPVFPNFEVANVLVRLPSRASNPTSERVDGETWSGITRAYRLYPMTVGQFEIPAKEIRITYADPSTRTPIVAVLNTEPIVLEGTIPAGAEDLIPFIAAEALTVSQTIEGNPGNMAPGDTVVRTLTAEIEGVSPMFLPPLLADSPESGLSVYRQEPVVMESESRGRLSGTRLETATYVAEAGGRYRAEPISLAWFNLKTNMVEKVRLNGIDFAVPGETLQNVDEPPDSRQQVLRIMAGAGMLIVIVLFARRFTPALLQTYRAWWTRWQASERIAFQAALAALARRDFSASDTAIKLWRQRMAVDEVAGSGLSHVLAHLGRRIYGVSQVATSQDDWVRARDELIEVRNRYRKSASRREATGRLPPLNPGTQA